MPSKYELCPQCGAILKTSVCLKCGHDSTEIAEILAAEETLDSEDHEVVKVTPEKIEAHEQVQSIFNDIATASGVADDNPKTKIIKKRYLAPMFLSLVLFALAGLSYWRFVYFTPEYVSPLVLSAADVKALDGAVESTASIAENSENQKTIELDSGLDEGNFAVGNFAQFGATNTKVFVQAFNIKNIFAKFRNESILEEIQEEYNISDDDLGVYFSSGFGYFIPGDDLDTWGFVIKVNDETYVDDRLTEFRENKEDPEYEYVDYYASLVEVETASEEVEESTESAEEDEDADNSDEEDENSEEESEEAEESGSNLYLLVSNSNEYLDQMEESSEGNLTNLANEVIYAQSKADLPQLGEVLVYKVKDAAVWPTLVDIVADKYTYVGLDKVLETVRSTGAAFYSVDSKLRIMMSEN